VVELEAMAMALLDNFAVPQIVIARVRLGSRLALTVVDPTPHSSAHVREFALVGHEVDDGILRTDVESRAVRLVIADDISGKFDTHDLHAQAEAEIGDLVLAGEAGSNDFAFDAAIAEAARHDNSVDLLQLPDAASLFEIFGADPGNIHIPATGKRGMDQGFLDA